MEKDSANKLRNPDTCTDRCSPLNGWRDEQCYKALFQDSRNVMLLIEASSGRIVDANSAAVDFYGYSMEELCRMPVDALNLLPAQEVRKEMDRARQERINHFQFKHRLQNGTIRHVQVFSGPVKIADRTYLCSTIHDVSDKVEAEEKLMESTECLRESNRDLQQLTYLISHDLKAPLMNLHGYAAELDLVLEELEDLDWNLYPFRDAEHSERFLDLIRNEFPSSLHYIRQSSDRISKYINNLLELSRVGRMEVRRERVDLQVIFNRIKDSLNQQIEQKGAVLEAGFLPVIRTDPNIIEQVLSNLLANAIRYGATDRPNQISVSLETLQKGNRIEVRDTGIGIRKQDLDTIFAPMRRLQSNGSDGEGMGLAFVQALVRKLEGRVWCESEEGKGSRFFVVLPFARENRGDDAV